MRFASIAVLIASVATGCHRGPAKPPPPPAIAADTDLIDYMLRTRGLSRETARLDPATLDTQAGYQSRLQPHFLRYWKNPWDFPKFACAVMKDLQAYRSEAEFKGLFQTFAYSQVRTGHRAAWRWDYVPSMEADKDAPVAKAMEELAERCEVTLFAADKEEASAAVKDAPMELRVQMAKLLKAAGEAGFYRDRALRNIPWERRQHAFDYAVRNFTIDDENPPKEFEDGAVVNWDLGHALDYDDMYTGAAIVLKTIVDLEQFLSSAPADLSKVAFEFSTPLGKVAFNGKNENNVYEGGDYLLIVDLGGDDTYRGAAAATRDLEHPVSIVVDWAGNDTYVADKETPCAQGAGILGYGFLVDNAGNDTFTAVNDAQGMCYFGVGILWDNGGDDVFKAHTAVQGSASFGVANLVKIGGKDSYHAYYCSQGFGGIEGIGCLIDTDGNDKYVGEPYDIVHQAKWGHDNLRNYSFCQGTALGQRGDIFGGHSMAGGTGVLQDLGGDDWYECGVYGQAAAYWYGTGILHDKSGNDHYEGSFFVQSSGVHMGMTMLLEEGGNDTYHVWRAISQAGAHDAAVSFLVDRGGDDTFSSWGWKDKEGKQTLTNTGVKGQDGGTLTGSAINNSVAVFINIGGNDTYELYTKDSLGWSFQNGEPGSWRFDNFNVAMFIDVGGQDKYTTNEQQGAPDGWGVARNDASWTRATDEPGNKEKNFSMGLDAEKGKVPEAEY